MVSPLFVKYSKVVLNPETGTPLEFQCSVTQVAVTSEGGDVVSQNTQCPDGSFSETNPRTYQLSITGVQDVEDLNGLMWWAWDHDTEVVSAQFWPKADGQGNPVGYGLEGDVTVSLPSQVGGGDIGSFATTDLVFPYNGKPTRIDSDGNPSGGGAAATGATAGTPGTWTPSGATPPATAAAAGSVTASPDTAWATGEYVQGATAGTAGEMYWDGSAWTAGKAP
jgi:hypothetical protein